MLSTLKIQPHHEHFRQMMEELIFSGQLTYEELYGLKAVMVAGRLGFQPPNLKYFDDSMLVEISGRHGKRNRLYTLPEPQSAETIIRRQRRMWPVRFYVDRLEDSLKAMDRRVQKARLSKFINESLPTS